MNIKIEIDCRNAAIHDDPIGEITRILATVPEKLATQLEHDGRCICEALEFSNKLMDINGNTVGIMEVKD